MKYAKYVFFAFMLAFSHAQAQWNYVVDVIRGDSTALVQRVNNKGEFVKGDTVTWLHNGDTVLIAKVDSGFAKMDNSLVIITLDKQKYFVDRKDLMFGDNPVDKTDFVNSSTKTLNRHSRWGHLYLGDINLYWLIFGLVLAATLFALFGRGWLLAFVPLFLLGATVIEVYGLLNFGTDMLWWIEGAKFRSWHDISRLLLFAFAVTFQVGSLYLYKRKINEDGGDLVVWRPVVSALFGAIAAMAVMWVCSFLHVRQNYINIIGIAVFCIVAGKGFIGSMIDNCEVLSIFGGIMFTLFVLIWGVGALAAVALLVMSVLKSVSTLIALPIAVVLLFALLMLGGIAGSSSSSSSFSDSPKDLSVDEMLAILERERIERPKRDAELKKAKLERERAEKEAEAAAKRKREEEEKIRKMQEFINKNGW